MRRRFVAGFLCLIVVAGIAWLSQSGLGQKQEPAIWPEVAPGVYASPGWPKAYAVVDADFALLIDAAHGPKGLKTPGANKIEAVLLTHHHRDGVAAVKNYLDAGVPVRAPKASAEWLLPAGVSKYWKESLPLRGSRTAYLVVPAGFDNIDCSLTDGQKITWRGWSIEVVATPGHSMDHVAYLLRKGKNGPLIVCCGDALAAPGKLWTPYTTDWDHWTDLGLKPAAASLRKLAERKPDVLLPAHGEPMRGDCVKILGDTAAAIEEMAFLKSFERFTKQRLGNAPEYKFLVKEQAESNGSKPWSQVSPHLYVTGNTFALVSKEKNSVLVVDPWGDLSVKQLAKLRQDKNLGPIETVMFSHAHYDHYDGIHGLADRDKLQVWTLDKVAVPLADPFRFRAPFLDGRPVQIDRTPKDGDTLTWREYRFRFHFLPGQSEYTMGFETVIDGKRCFFTADNFFHQDMFSGSGGWMGLNRSWPGPYAASAKKVLDAAPDWVLAEHGGPFEFNAEDFRRRVKWGEVSAKAADALCVSGNHLLDWNPHHIRAEPVLVKAKAGERVKVAVFIENPLAKALKCRLAVENLPDGSRTGVSVEVPARGVIRREQVVNLPEQMRRGRHVIVFRVESEMAPDCGDGFLVVEVE